MGHKHNHRFVWTREPPDADALSGVCSCKLTVALPVATAIPLVPARPARVRLPQDRHGVTRKLTIHTPDGDLDGYLTVNTYADRRPGEMFVRVAKQGSAVAGFADAVAVAVSIGLQYGVPLAAYTSKFRHTAFEPAGSTGDPEQPFASSLLDLMAGWLERHFKLGSP